MVGRKPRRADIQPFLAGRECKFSYMDKRTDSAELATDKHGSLSLPSYRVIQPLPSSRTCIAALNLGWRPNERRSFFCSNKQSKQIVFFPFDIIGNPTEWEKPTLPRQLSPSPRRHRTGCSSSPGSIRTSFHTHLQGLKLRCCRLLRTGSAELAETTAAFKLEFPHIQSAAAWKLRLSGLQAWYSCSQATRPLAFPVYFWELLWDARPIF